MSTEWNWPGARWWKFDFHTHTPASDDYGKGPDQASLKSRTPEEWLLDYMRAGIDCVAITDHNTGAWIDKLKDALESPKLQNHSDFRPLYLFPGVEISVNGGVHILALFPLDATTSDINDLIAVARYHGTKGKTDGCTEESLVKVVEEIVKAGGIAIPAHADQENGIFKLQGVTLEQALSSDKILAIELADTSNTKPQLYVDKGLSWTEVLGSDAHHPTGVKCPGSHFTWIKMSSPTLEGLRLAVLDGPLSIRRSDDCSTDPNSHGHLIIEGIEIKDARYMGRGSVFKLDLNPWQNAIIGGRGTGKSTLVEFLRIALRQEEELPKSLKEDFAKYRKEYRSREDDGLLTSDAQIIVSYRKENARFRVQWNIADNIEGILERRASGSWEQVEGDIRQRFPVRIYSQKQIFELAKAPMALLQIVDEATEVDRRSWNERWREEETRFLSLRAKAREIEASLGDEPRLRGELDDVKRKLAVFEKAGHSQVLKAYQMRLRQRRALETWEESWADAGDRVRQLAADLVPDPLDSSSFAEGDIGDRSVLGKAEVAEKQLEGIRKSLEELAEKADQALVEWRRNRDESEWKKAVDRAVSDYEELLEKLSEEDAGDPSAYAQLVQRRHSIEERLKEFTTRQEELSRIREDADAVLGRLQELRRELTQRRIEFLDKVLAANPYVQIKVLPYGARETVESEFRQLIQRDGGGFEKDIGGVNGEGLLGGLIAGPADAKSIEERLLKLKEAVRQIAAGEYDPAKLRDQRFATHLSKLPPEALDRLDLWFPEDSLDVQYSTTADGKDFRSIQEGSPGQRTAALLAFLLSYGEEPIILDQPEDDLDNQLIYDLIVTQIRNTKQRRQVIVVTHNANIVVNGDAELVVALDARAGQTRKICEGSLQEQKVRDEICKIMEGGREAFELRYRRISIGSSSA